MVKDQDGAAAAVKARRAATPNTRRTRTEPEPEPLAGAASPTGDRSVGLTSDSPRPPGVLTGSFIAGHTTSSDYIIAPSDAYTSWYPRGAQQPSTVRLWSRGQQVHRDYYAQHGGDGAARTPADAKPTNEPGGGVPLPSWP
jgi:hypothetical protein